MARYRLRKPRLQKCHPALAPLDFTMETLSLIHILLKAGLIKEGFEADAAWLDALAEIVRPRTKMPADAATVAAPVFATAETLAYDEKSVSKGLAKEGMGAVLDAARTALEAVTDWTAENIDGALEPLPEVLDVKKRLVFGAVRVAECGNMVSPPLGETMALIGRDDCLARIDRARPMALYGCRRCLQDRRPNC